VTYTFVLGGPPPSGVLERELTKAHGRTITWRLDGTPTAQFSIDGRVDEAAGIVALATDLTVFDDGAKVFRGRIGPESDDIGPSSHACQFTATGYRGMLARRQTGAGGAAYTATVAGVIAMDLIATSQALPGGDWTIAAGVGTTTGALRDRTIDPGKPVVESIDEMGRLDGGYEWEIDADLHLNLWHPMRGADNAVVLDYGGLISSARRQLDPNDFANSALVTGSSGLTPVTATTADIATDPRGRWETSAGYPSILNQSTLDARGPWLADQAAVLRPTWSATMRPGRWGGPSHVWLGDTVVLVVRSGRLNVAARHRVVEVGVQPGDDGDDTVTFGLLAAAAVEA
jgi:hypothetical protein